MLANLQLDEAIARLDPSGTAAGRRVETLLKTDRLRLVLVTMRAGALPDEHEAPGPIALQWLPGRLELLLGNETQRLEPGTMLALEPGVRHAVRAAEDGAFLLTIGWPGAGE